MKFGPPYPSKDLYDGDDDEFLQEVCYIVSIAIGGAMIGQRTILFNMSGNGFSSNIVQSTLNQVERYRHCFKG
jgi:hypothetical protein